MPGEKILLVDDDDFIRDFLCELLQYADYQVSVAVDGREALSLFDRKQFDLVISDMEMPKMNGIELIKELKNTRKCEIPILFLTANDKVSLAIEAMKLGATDYIVKEENIQDALLISVEKAFEQLRINLERQRLAKKNVELLNDLQTKNNELEKSNTKNVYLLRELTDLNEQLEDRIRHATLDLRQSLSELSALYEVSKAVSSLMDLDDLLDLVITKSVEVMHAQRCSLMLMNKAKTHLQFRVTSVTNGQHKKKLTASGIPVDDNSISGWVANHAQPVLIPDAYSDSRFNPAYDPAYDQKTGFRTKSILCVPLLHKENVLGVIMVLNHVEGRAYTKKELSTFALFSNQAAIAIENARLYEEQKQMAEELRGALERERWISIEKEKMGKYIPKSLIDDIHRNREEKLALGGKSVEATVLFSDIQGFTRISERSEPQRVIKFLNQYMTAMTDIIEHNKGVLDKFIGDGLMAVFLPSEQDHRHALRAIKSAVEMQLAISEIAKTWEEHNFGRLNVRVGINSGPMVSGNIGSETRMDYTVIGDNVNLSQRLESACEVGKILISESTYSMVEDLIKAEKIDPIIVKNREQPVQPYLVNVEENKALIDTRVFSELTK